MSALMFIRRGSSWRWPRAACTARSGNTDGEIREYGRIANRPAALDRLARKLGDDRVGLRFCYEAGPCGYGIQRHLSARGHECIVVAPSLIPKRAGDRVKTDRRDAASLARLHRAGELTAVWVPDPGHEAMRDPGLRRGRLWCAPVSMRCMRCPTGQARGLKAHGHASSYRAFCCVRVAITGGRLGPGGIADGLRGSGSSRRRITSCSRTACRRSKPPRPGATG